MEHLLSGYEIMCTDEGWKIGVKTWLLRTLRCKLLCLGINSFLF